MTATTATPPLAFRKPTDAERELLRAAFPKGASLTIRRVMDLVVEPRAKRDDDAADPADDNAPIPIALSSESPVLRYDWWEDELYYEVLDHQKKSVDLTYARDGLPFLLDHRTRDSDAQHGIIENVRVEDERVRGDLRMSRAQRSQEIAADIRDGIRKKVSVGYILGEEYTQTKGGEDGIPTRRYTAWMPIEGSNVPVPADYDVGYGRSAEGSGGTPSAMGAALPMAARELLERHAATHPVVPVSRTPSAPAPAPTADDLTQVQPEAHQGKERTMETKEQAPAGPSVQVTRDAEAAAEESRINSIKKMARDHGLEDKAGEWIRSGKSELEVSREVNATLADRLNKPISAAAPLDLTKEKRNYSFARAILEQAGMADENRVDAGFEREITQELRKTMPNTTRSGAMVIPLNFEDRFAEEYAKRQGREYRAGIDSGTSTTGGAFKFTQPGDFLGMLRNRTALLRLGAMFLAGLTGPVSFPKQNAAGSASWIGENSGSDTGESNLTVTTVSLAFKTLMSTTSVSRQALFSAASGNYDLEAIIRSDMSLVVALALDAGGISGPGTANQPTGILNDTAVTTLALGTAGGTMAWGNWVDLETAVGNNNGDQLAGLGYLTNPTQRGVAKKTGVLGNTNSGIPIWSGTAGEPDGQVNGYRAVSTKQVPNTLTKGSVTTCSAAIFGAFSALMIGQFGNGFEILADPFRLKKQAMIELTAFTFADIARRYSEGFSVIKDAL